MIHLEPIVLQSLLSADSLLSVTVQQLSDQVLALRRDTLKLFMIEVEVNLLDLLENLSVRLSLEGKVSTHEGVQEDAKRPHIGLGSVTSLEHFRGHVERSTGNCRHLLLLRHL